MRNEYEFKSENQKEEYHTERISVNLIIILRPLLGDGTLDTCGNEYARNNKGPFGICVFYVERTWAQKLKNLHWLVAVTKEWPLKTQGRLWTGCCEQDEELSSYIKGKEFSNYQSDYELLTTLESGIIFAGIKLGLYSRILE
jgi:hypothetical protein